VEPQQHHTRGPLPSAGVLLVLERVAGECMHRTWSITERGRLRYAVCDSCREEIPLSDNGSECPLAVEEIREAFLRSLARPGQDELYANKLVRKVEAAGWQFTFASSGDFVGCTLSNGADTFRSGPHRFRCQAILSVLVELARSGKFNRPG
jgi:hypothetical protein